MRVVGVDADLDGPADPGGGGFEAADGLVDGGIVWGAGGWGDGDVQADDGAVVDRDAGV